MLYNLLRKFLCDSDIRVLESNLKDMEKLYTEKSLKVEHLRSENQELFDEIDKINADKQRILSDLDRAQGKLGYHPQAEYWDNKYPKAYVTYAGRYLPDYREDAKLRKIEFPVQLFITPGDPWIQRHVKNAGLSVKNPLVCNKEIVKIYRDTRLKPSNPYRYAYDEPNTGVNELWFLPVELRYAKKGDCDDYANELVSYLLAAGVPRWRVRATCGYTWGGIGHATVYVLGDDLETWYHLNSTTRWSTVEANGWEDLIDFPKFGDSDDDIGIKDVWFSFDSKFAWHSFTTSSAEKTYKKKREGWLKNINIRPL